MKKNKVVTFLLICCIGLTNVLTFAQENNFEVSAKDVLSAEKADSIIADVIADELSREDTGDSVASVNNAKSQFVSEFSNAEVVVLDFDEEGNLISAQSSVRENVIKDFGSYEKESVEETAELVNKSNVALDKSVASPKSSSTIYLTNQGDTSGRESGAFHRLVTPASTSATQNYSGGVANSITLPQYNIATASSLSNGTESADLYIGIDMDSSHRAEIGLTTNLTAWKPTFNIRAPQHTLIQGVNNLNGTYYYDGTHTYPGGTTINNFKVYYKVESPGITSMYLLLGSNMATIYKINVPFTSNTTKVKRLTTLAKNKNPNTGSYIDINTSLDVPMTSDAVWNNFKFLLNNGSSTQYPGQMSNLQEDVWVHGMTIKYTKNVISSTSRTESYRIY